MISKPKKLKKMTGTKGIALWEDTRLLNTPMITPPNPKIINQRGRRKLGTHGIKLTRILISPFPRDGFRLRVETILSKPFQKT